MIPPLPPSVLHTTAATLRNMLEARLSGIPIGPRLGTDPDEPLLDLVIASVQNGGEPRDVALSVLRAAIAASMADLLEGRHETDALRKLVSALDVAEQAAPVPELARDVGVVFEAAATPDAVAPSEVQAAAVRAMLANGVRAEQLSRWRSIATVPDLAAYAARAVHEIAPSGPVIDELLADLYVKERHDHWPVRVVPLLRRFAASSALGLIPRVHAQLRTHLTADELRDFETVFALDHAEPSSQSVPAYPKFNLGGSRRRPQAVLRQMAA